MKRVFISYCHEDGDFVDNLAHKLREEGIQTWLDSDLYGGQNWRSEIDLAIREAMAVIAIVSPDSVGSDYVKYEWAFALGVGVNVIPVLLRVDPETLHPALRGRQCLDFSSRSARPWDLLFRAVKGAGPTAPETTIRLPANTPPVLERAVRGLDSMDPAERKAALDAIQTMHHPAVVEVLAGAVTHPIQDVRLQAGIMLLGLGDKRALTAAFESLRDGWSGVYARDLARLGREVLPELMSALEDRSGNVRAVAARALAHLGERAAIPSIKRLLADPKDYVGVAAIEALGSYQDPDLLPVFRDGMQKPETARAALRAAADIPDGGGEAVLLEALQSPNEDVRGFAAELLAASATPAAVPALRAAMKDPDSFVRAQAVKAIGQRKSPDDVPALLEALDDDESHIRREASEALAAIGGPDPRARLIQILRSPDFVHREDAIGLLGKIGDASVVPVLAELLSDPNVRLEAVHAIEPHLRPGDPAIPEVVRLLSEEHPLVRVAAAEALAAAADPATTAVLAGLLGDSSVRDAAIEGLRRIGTLEARKAVVAATRR
jgi:HEAT repeat protein